MGKANFTDEFKRDAVAQITERGYPVSEVSRRLGVSPDLLPKIGGNSGLRSKVIGWGWFYLSTILDDYSHYIIAWKLCTGMKAKDVTQTMDLALEASGLSKRDGSQRPRLLIDNGASYISGDLVEWFGDRKIQHIRGAPHHPQAQGKIERWHQTLKNRILLENYFLPGDLEQQIEAFADRYNHHRYHESLDNVTPADAYFGRAAFIIERRNRIKQQTLETRRLNHKTKAA